MYLSKESILIKKFINLHIFFTLIFWKMPRCLLLDIHIYVQVMCRFSKAVLQTGSKYGRDLRVLARLSWFSVLYLADSRVLTWLSHGFWESVWANLNNLVKIPCHSRAILLRGFIKNRNLRNTAFNTMIPSSFRALASWLISYQKISVLCVCFIIFIHFLYFF